MEKKFIRSDTKEISLSLREKVNIRVGMLCFFALSVILSFLLFKAAGKPRQIVVIDSGTGKTFAGLPIEDVTTELLGRQLVYYSKKFVEGIYTIDYRTAKEERLYSLSLMSRGLFEKMPKNFEESSDVLKGILNKGTCFYEWSFPPAITKVNPPYYTVFCQVERTIQYQNGEKEKKQYSLILEWGRDVKGSEPVDRPHDLYLMKWDEYAATDKEVIEQLRSISLINK